MIRKNIFLLLILVYIGGIFRRSGVLICVKLCINEFLDAWF